MKSATSTPCHGNEKKFLSTCLTFIFETLILRTHSPHFIDPFYERNVFWQARHISSVHSN